MRIEFTKTSGIPAFGVAGNFTGHLEQAGEARDFLNVKTKDASEPKALFPTFIPSENAPDFLQIFPFSSEKIIFPSAEILNSGNVQIEPECALMCSLSWKNDKAVAVKPYAFCASNDCSIRKEGAKKISEKKNWGPCSKGKSSHFIEIENYEEGSVLDIYNIASFLVRDGKAFAYGIDSEIKNYSYLYKKLSDWILEKLNAQKNEGPAEDIHSYIENFKPENIFVSIGATRYTEFGEHNFLKENDESVVVLYPREKYSSEKILSLVESGELKQNAPEDMSVLWQKVVLE